MTMTVNATDRLWDVVEPFLAAECIELDDLELVGAGKGRVLRVIVDAEGGVDLDHIASLSRSLSRLLDEDESLAGPYTLEVTSPGLERKLRRSEHYRKSIGREVKVKTSEPIHGAHNHRGKVTAVDDAEFEIAIDSEKRRIPFQSVISAQTVFTWERGAKPGKKP
jgi:ribosome maturation factor RimP